MDTRNVLQHANEPGVRQRRLRSWTVLAAMLVTMTAAVTPATAQPVPVSVRRDSGAYHVTATFTTPRPVSVVHAVLTDYERIPHFMPDVRSSRVLERSPDGAVVEQEAVARVLFFSKKVRLVLEVQEAPAHIRFRDRCGKSFTRYEGQWTLREEGGRAVIGYELLAEPGFDVPEFVLTRLLKRDSGRMIARLKAEIASASVDAADRQP